MAKKVKALIVPVGPQETEEQPYGTDANAVHRTNLGPHRVLSARVGYFIQQHQILRSHIEELEDKVVAAENAVKVEKAKKALKGVEANTQEDYARLKKRYDADMERYDKLLKDYDKLEEMYHRATTNLHNNGLNCGDEECKDCKEAYAEAK